MNRKQVCRMEEREGECKRERGRERETSRQTGSQSDR